MPAATPMFCGMLSHKQANKQTNPRKQNENNGLASRATMAEFLIEGFKARRQSKTICL